MKSWNQLKIHVEAITNWISRRVSRASLWIYIEILLRWKGARVQSLEKKPDEEFGSEGWYLIKFVRTLGIQDREETLSRFFHQWHPGQRQEVRVQHSSKKFLVEILRLKRVSIVQWRLTKCCCRVSYMYEYTINIYILTYLKITLKRLTYS